jgi:hypothetical protein
MSLNKQANQVLKFSFIVDIVLRKRIKKVSIFSFGIPPSLTPSLLYFFKVGGNWYSIILTIWSKINPDLRFSIAKFLSNTNGLNCVFSNLSSFFNFGEI